MSSRALPWIYFGVLFVPIGLALSERPKKVSTESAVKLEAEKAVRADVVVKSAESRPSERVMPRAASQPVMWFLRAPSFSGIGTGR